MSPTPSGRLPCSVAIFGSTGTAMPYTRASVASPRDATVSAARLRDDVSRLIPIVNVTTIVNVSKQESNRQTPRPTRRMGDTLRAAREARRLSTQAAAAAADISTGYLFKLESGFVGTPSPRVLHRLAGVLDLGYWQLMELAGYVVPDAGAEAGTGSQAAPAPAPDPILRIAESLEAIRDELITVRKILESREHDGQSGAAE
ncbi:helix-turn-helix transcriptional regulator [Actinomadura syzygii]|uniref:Helix-turn-helix transcriptional regulator n=1 Tax=Actinomadura syzygii TaxID=1427538 RepID=A0A5D0UBR2_9ACTN|nr:helix-turn-helix transcriptional regulator [Actinomadura syzygii]